MPARRTKTIKVVIEVTEHEREQLQAKARRAGTTIQLLLLRGVLAEPTQAPALRSLARDVAPKPKPCGCATASPERAATDLLRSARAR
jgi:hypothetical protein